MNFEIREAAFLDAEKLSDLAKDTFYHTWKDYNTPADMAVYLSRNFQKEELEKEILNARVFTYWLAFAEGTMIGYCKLRRDQSHEEFMNQPAIELERLYIRQEYFGKGVADLLMKKSIQTARTEKYTWLWLGVNVDNHRALAFYKKYGFETFGIKMFKLGDTEDPDYLMKLNLKNT